MEYLIPAEFNGTPIQIIDRDGQKWLTAEQAGRCLGYDESHARNRVTKIYERHGDEFSESDSIAVKLTANSRGNPTTRIFSATGCIKLGFFANSQRAKEFRAWASKVLAGHPATLPAVTRVHELEVTVDALTGEIRGLLSNALQAERRESRLLRKIITLQDKQHRLLMVAEQRNARETIITLAREGVPRDVIQQLTGRTYNHIRQVIWQDKQGRPYDRPEQAQSNLVFEVVQ